jgi:hypothetical protein
VEEVTITTCSTAQHGTTHQVNVFHYTKSVYCYVRIGTHLTALCHHDMMYMTVATYVFNTTHHDTAEQQNTPQHSKDDPALPRPTPPHPSASPKYPQKSMLAG